MAARRAKPVQRGGCQGLRGNPDACRPRRGSACDASEHGAPAEAQRSGFGGESFPAERRQWRIKRAGKKERRDWRASLARESQCRDGSKGTVEGVSFAACGEANDLELVPTKRASMRGWSLPCPYNPPPPRAPVWGVQGAEPPALLFPHFFGKKWGRRRRPKLRIVRFRAGPKAHSLRWASSPHDDHSVGSPRGPHWARPAGGAPGRRATTGRPYGCGRMISAPTGRAVDIPCRADPSPGGPGK